LSEWIVAADHHKENVVTSRTGCCSVKQASALYESALRLEPSQGTMAEIVRQLRIAADAGNARAMNHLGWLYLNGKYLKENIPQGIGFLESAASAGFAEAGYKLGLIYLHGHGVRRDIPMALQHFAIAARNGHEPSDSRWRWLMSLEGFLWARGSLLSS
jgi:TPR repeat protein